MKRLFAVCLSMAVVTGAFAAEPLKLRKDNIDEIVKAMTIEEKAHLVVGTRMRDNQSAAGEVGYHLFFVFSACIILS